MAKRPRESDRPWRGSALAGVLLVCGVGAAGLLIAPAAAPAADEKSADELAGEAINKLLQALDLLIGSIPQYEAPYVNENGDIIIRRKRDDGGDAPLPTPEEKPARPDEPDTTTT